MRKDTTDQRLLRGKTKVQHQGDKRPMNIILSADYELFFGVNTGSVANTLLEPSQALCDVAASHGVPLVFFVDIGFLLRLREAGRKFPALMRNHDRIMRQLEQFVAVGHEIQLHIHPHWEDSHWNGESWNIDTRRYQLHDFGEFEISEIVQRYADALRDITGGDGVSAYRAGGWMIQPFLQIREALRDAGIFIDSTIFAGGSSEGDGHFFDFAGAPSASHWFFDNDPLVINPEGDFLEIPIASYRLSPLFYWRFALAKKFGGAMHKSYGNGRAIPMGRAELLRKLTHWTNSVVSMDGYKTSFLEDAFLRYELEGKSDFVVMGHPKALTRYSIQQLEHFIARRKASKFVGYESYHSLLINRKSRGNNRVTTAAKMS